MSSTATEAPSSAKRPLSPEHLAKMKAGGERYRANQKAGRDKIDAHIESRTPIGDAGGATALAADLAAENERLKAELAKLKPDPAEVAKLPKNEIYFECNTGSKIPGTDDVYAPRIDSPDDPKWDEIIALGRPVHGTLITNRLVRAGSGEVLERHVVNCLAGQPPHVCRDQMRAFLDNGGAHLSHKKHVTAKVYDAKSPAEPEDDE